MITAAAVGKFRWEHSLIPQNEHTHPPDKKTRAISFAPLAIFALALVVRLIYLAQAWRWPLFQVPMLDADAYYQMAKHFASGHWLYPAGKPYWQPPFYPVVLGFWIMVAGKSVLAIKLAQMALGAINCVLVYVLGARVLDRRVGLVAGIAAALYGPMVYFDGELLTPVLQIFFNLCALLLLLSAAERRSPLLFGAAGLMLGLSAITRADVLVFAVFALIWTAITLRRKCAVALTLMVLGIALPIAPVTVRNVVVGKDFIPISWNGGINFYIGNNPDEERTRELRPGPEWDSMLAMAERHKQNPRPSEKSAFFFTESLQYIKGSPLGWAVLLVKKSVMFITAIEGRRNLDPYANREHSSLYSILVFRAGPFAFPFGLVLPLAVLGMVTLPRGRGAGLLYAYLGAQFVAVAAFFVCARYRITAVPVLLIFAGQGVVSLRRITANRNWRKHAVPLGLTAFALMLSNLNIYGVDNNRNRIDAETQLYLASALEAKGDIDEAIAAYRRSIRLDPDREVPRLSLAVHLMEKGDYDEAREHLERAVDLNPASAPSNARLGEVLEMQGEPDAAVRHYAAAAKADGRFVDLLAGLAERAYAAGNYNVAARALSAALEVDPNWAEAHRTLGLTLLKLDRVGEAIEHLKVACDLDPRSADCFIALGLAHLRSGDPKQAESAFATAVKIGPKQEVRKRIEEYRQKLR